MDSDIQDYKRFPSRLVENAASVFDFLEPNPAQRQRYALAIETITYDGEKHDLDTFLVP